MWMELGKSFQDSHIKMELNNYYKNESRAELLKGLLLFKGAVDVMLIHRTQKGTF